MLEIRKNEKNKWELEHISYILRSFLLEETCKFHGWNDKINSDFES